MPWAAAAGACFWITPYVLVFGFFLLVLPALLAVVPFVLGMYCAAQAINRPATLLGTIGWGLLLALVYLSSPTEGAGLIEGGFASLFNAIASSCLACSFFRFIVLDRRRRQAAS